MNEVTDILLVEDSPADAELVMAALNNGEGFRNLHHVRDGVQAMAFLRQEDPFADAPRPDLIFLDLKLPRKNGWEVLADIRSDPKLQSLVVAILSSSDQEEDITAAYALNCNAYATKPVDANKFFKTVRDIEHFFVCVVRLPPNPLQRNLRKSE